MLVVALGLVAFRLFRQDGLMPDTVSDTGAKGGETKNLEEEFSSAGYAPVAG